MSASRKTGLFVFVTIALDAMGIGLIVPVMPKLLEELSGLALSEAVLWSGYLGFSYALMQFLFSPTIGALSDRYGRRPVLLISLFTLGIDYIILALAPNLWVLFIGRILAGISGATYATAHAVIADVTPKEDRAAAFGMVGAGFGVGFVLGPAIGGLLGELGARAPFIAAAILAFANVGFGWFAMKETLAPEHRRPFAWHRANPLGAAMQVSKIPVVAWFLGVMVLYGLAHTVYPTVWSFFTKEKFEWSEWEIGLSLAAFGVFFAFVQGFLMRYIVRWLGEVKTAWFGFVGEIIALIGIAAATHAWMIYVLLPLAALGNVTGPAISALMANRIGDDGQGELQGVIASSQAMVAVVAPLVMTGIFHAFTDGEGAYVPGAPFYLAALILLLAMAPFALGLRRGQSRPAAP